MSVEHLWEAPELPFDRSEILRYAALPEAEAASVAGPLEACLRETGGRIRCRGVWRVYPVRETGDALDLGFATTESRSLRSVLAGCGEIGLFAMTAGLEMDRLIARAGVQSPVRGLLMHAIGAERVESACDAFCGQLGALVPGRTCRGRFSPGYGDLPLTMQRQVFAALRCERNLGMQLGQETLLMTPSKSVTAIAALGRET